MVFREVRDIKKVTRSQSLDINRNDSMGLRTKGPALIAKATSFSDFVAQSLDFKCLANNIPLAEQPLHFVVPGLLREMRIETGDTALRSLHELCDNRNRHNRVPILSSSKWDLLAALIQRLNRIGGQGLHLVCLTLNNLSIPYPNKAQMIHGPNANALLTGLCRIIKEGKPEACICLICLVNLSLHQQAIDPIIRFVPDCSTPDPQFVIDEPCSLIRLIERHMNSNPHIPDEISVQSETIRWACALVSNLSVSELNARIISCTDIPVRILGYLWNSPTDTDSWTVESVEDFALRVMNRLAWWPSSRKCLVSLDAEEVMRKVGQGEGEYAVKAMKIANFFEAKGNQN